MKRIMIDKDKCMGCMSCVLACMDYHNPEADGIYGLDLEDPKNESRQHLELLADGSTVPIICRHCSEPECVLTCMSGAMTKNPDTGYTDYDEDQCAACFMCVMSCPFGVLKPDSGLGDKILKCDMCKDRDQPLCVENCPTGTLYLMEVDS